MCVCLYVGVRAFCVYVCACVHILMKKPDINPRCHSPGAINLDLLRQSLSLGLDGRPASSRVPAHLYSARHWNYKYESSHPGFSCSFRGSDSGSYIPVTRPSLDCPSPRPGPPDMTLFIPRMDSIVTARHRTGTGHGSNIP